MTNPYVLITVDGKRVAEHRHMMSKFLGRPLLRREVVHHKNGDKTDNRIENLELHPSQSAHVAEHRQTFASETHRECVACGEIKPRFEFPTINRKDIQYKRDNHSARCKPCESLRKRLAYQRNPQAERDRKNRENAAKRR